MGELEMWMNEEKDKEHFREFWNFRECVKSPVFS